MKSKNFFIIFVLLFTIINFSYAIEDKSVTAINFYDKYSFYFDALFLSFLCITFISYGLANAMKEHEEDVRKIGYVLGMIMGISTAYGIYSGLFGTFRKLFMASPFFLFGILLFFTISLIKPIFSSEDNPSKNNSLKDDSPNSYLKNFAIILGATFILFVPLLMGGYGLNVQMSSDGTVSYLQSNNQLKLGFGNEIEQIVKTSNPYYLFLKYLIIAFNFWQVAVIVFFVLLLTSLTKMITPEGMEIIQEKKEKKTRDDPVIKSQEKIEDAKKKTEDSIKDVAKLDDQTVATILDNAKDSIESIDPEKLESELKKTNEISNQENEKIKEATEKIKENLDKEREELKNNNSNNNLGNEDLINDEENKIKLLTKELEDIKNNSDNNKINLNNNEINSEIEKINKSLLELSKIKRGMGASNAKIISKIDYINKSQIENKESLGNMIQNIVGGLKSDYSEIINEIEKIEKNSGYDNNKLSNEVKDLKKYIASIDENFVKNINKSNKDTKENLNIVYNEIVNKIESRAVYIINDILSEIKEKNFKPLSIMIQNNFKRTDIQIKRIAELVNFRSPENQKVIKELLENTLGRRLNYLIGINKELTESIKKSQEDVDNKFNIIDKKVDRIQVLEKNEKKFQKEAKAEFNEIKDLILNLNNGEKEKEKLIEAINQNIIKNLELKVKFTSEKTIGSVYYVFNDIKSKLLQINKLNEFYLNYYFNQNLYDTKDVNFKLDFDEFTKRKDIFLNDQKIKKLLEGNTKNIFYSFCLTKPSIISAFYLYVQIYNQVFHKKNITIEIIEKDFLENLKKEYKDFDVIKKDVSKNIDKYISEGYNFENLSIIFNLGSENLNKYYSKILSKMLNNKFLISDAAYSFKNINIVYKKIKNYKLKNNGKLKINLKNLKYYIKNLEDLNKENKGRFSFIIVFLKKILGTEMNNDKFLFLIQLQYAHNNKKNYNWLYNNLNKKEIFLSDDSLELFNMINNYYKDDVNIDQIKSNLIDIKKHLNSYNLNQHKYFWNKMSEIFDINELKEK